MIKRFIVSQVEDFELYYILGFGALAIGLIYAIDFVYRKIRAKKNAVQSTDNPRNLP
jgi:hypothetical protein